LSFDVSALAGAGSGHTGSRTVCVLRFCAHRPLSPKLDRHRTDYQGQTPRVPEGFTATPFATGLEHPRRLLVLPNGDVVAEQRVGYVTLLRDEDGDGKAEWIQRHIDGLNGPYGLAWKDGTVLVPTLISASTRSRASPNSDRRR